MQSEPLLNESSNDKKTSSTITQCVPSEYPFCILKPNFISKKKNFCICVEHKFCSTEMAKPAAKWIVSVTGESLVVTKFLKPFFYSGIVVICF